MGSKPTIRRGAEENAPVLARLLRQFNDEYEEETPDHEVLLERIPDLITSGEGVFFLAGEDPRTRLGSPICNSTRRSTAGRATPISASSTWSPRDGATASAGRCSRPRSRRPAHRMRSTSVWAPAKTDTEARGLYESKGFTNFEGGMTALMLYYERTLTSSPRRPRA